MLTVICMQFAIQPDRNPSLLDLSFQFLDDANDGLALEQHAGSATQTVQFALGRVSAQRQILLGRGKRDGNFTGRIHTKGTSIN